MKNKIISLLLAISTSLIASNQFDININNTTLEVQHSTKISELSSRDGESQLNFVAGYLRLESDSQNRIDDLKYVGFNTESMGMDVVISLGINFLVVGTTNNTDDYVTVPLLMSIGYNDIEEGLGIELNAEVAPEVLSFGDTKNYSSIELRAKYSVFSGADVYIGTRALKVNDTDEALSTIKANRDVFVGYSVQY
jgi:hypothetical protein